MSERKIQTPSYNHLSIEDFNHVYPPSEDTFLFIDALEKDLNRLLELRPSVCLEIGVGSGLVITALGTALGDSCRYLGTDINPVACAKATETGVANGVYLETFCCEFASGIPKNLKGSIDVLLFNPPYVVTESEEVASGHLESTWAGGKDGREVIDRLLPQVPTLLSPKGLFYLILEKRNRPVEVTRVLNELGYQEQCVYERKSPSETLLVMRFQCQSKS